MDLNDSIDEEEELALVSDPESDFALDSLRYLGLVGPKSPSLILSKNDERSEEGNFVL